MAKFSEKVLTKLARKPVEVEDVESVLANPERDFPFRAPGSDRHIYSRHIDNRLLLVVVEPHDHEEVVSPRITHYHRDPRESEMPDYPHVIFDLRHRSLEVILSDASVAGTRELDDAHLVDVDADERPASIEILTLDDLRIEEMGDEFGFAEQVPSIRREIAKVLSPQTATTSGLSRPLEVQGTSILDPSGASPTENPPEGAAITPKEIPLLPR